MKNSNPRFNFRHCYALLIVLLFSCIGEEPSFIEDDPASLGLRTPPPVRVLQTQCNITGDFTTCSSSEVYRATYSGFSSPSFSWSILSGSGLSISGSSTSSTVRLNFTSGFTSGQLLLEVEQGLTVCSKIRVITKDNVPPRPGLISTNENPNGSTNHTICSFDLANSEFFVDPVPGATSYEWRVTPSSGVNYGTSLNFIDYFYAPPGAYSIDVRAVNSCGAGLWSGAGVTVTDCGPSFP